MLSRKTNPKVDWLKLLKIWKCTLSTHDKSILANKASFYVRTMLLNLVRLQSVFSFFMKLVPMYIHTSFISPYFLFKACSIFWNMKKSVNMQYYACPLAWSSQLWNCMVMQMICHKSAHPGDHGGLCNPSYWKDGFWGWIPVWGQTWPSEDSNHTCGQSLYDMD